MRPNMEEDLAAMRRATADPDCVYDPCDDECLYKGMPIIACEEILYLRARVNTLGGIAPELTAIAKELPTLPQEALDRIKEIVREVKEGGAG